MDAAYASLPLELVELLVLAALWPSSIPAWPIRSN